MFCWYRGAEHFNHDRYDAEFDKTYRIGQEGDPDAGTSCDCADFVADERPFAAEEFPYVFITETIVVVSLLPSTAPRHRQFRRRRQDFRQRYAG